jgi:hypothetical protein
VGPTATNRNSTWSPPTNPRLQPQPAAHAPTEPLARNGGPADRAADTPTIPQRRSLAKIGRSQQGQSSPPPQSSPVVTDSDGRTPPAERRPPNGLTAELREPMSPTDRPGDLHVPRRASRLISSGRLPNSLESPTTIRCAGRGTRSPWMVEFHGAVEEGRGK